MLIMFIFAALIFTAFLWVLDVALDNYKELGKARFNVRLELYRQRVVSDWRVKDCRKDITC